MLKVWGRANSSNVGKVMWCVGELGLAYARIDWAGVFGGNDDPDYRKINPMGLVPAIEQDDGFSLWESGAIIRYLCATHSPGNLYPADARLRAKAEQWMDWCSASLQPFNARLIAHLFVLPLHERDPAVIAKAVEDTTPMFDVLNQHLAERSYLCGDELTMADIPAGAMTHRWITFAPGRPSHPNLEKWYQRLAARPAFREHIMPFTPGR